MPLLFTKQNLVGIFRRRRYRLPLVSEHWICLQSGLCHLLLMTVADVTSKAQPVMK